MNSNRMRITGRLQQTARGAAIVTDAGDYWVLDECEPDPDLLGNEVIAEGVVSGFDRIRAEWIGSATE